MPTSTDHIVCPNCRAEVLFPPSGRTIHIAVVDGEEPCVVAPGFAEWELEAALRRAWEQYAGECDEE
jgi:hypothetical protein